MPRHFAGTPFPVLWGLGYGPCSASTAETSTIAPVRFGDPFYEEPAPTLRIACFLPSEPVLRGLHEPAPGPGICLEAHYPAILRLRLVMMTAPTRDQPHSEGPFVIGVYSQPSFWPQNTSPILPPHARVGEKPERSGAA
jgi:hypothetical protein